MQIAANGSFEPNVTGLLRCREWLVARQELATKRRIHMVYDFLAVATNLAIYAEIVFPKATSTAAFGFGKSNPLMINHKLRPSSKSPPGSDSIVPTG